MSFSSSSSSHTSHEVIITTSHDGPIVAYEASTGNIFEEFTGSRSPCRGLTMVGHELIAVSHVLSNTGGGSIHVYNWNTSTLFNNFPLPEPVSPLIATSDGAFLFAGGLSGTIHSLTLPSGNLIKSLSVHSKPISCLRLNDDGSLVISGSNDGMISLIPTFYLVEESSSYNSIVEQDPKQLILHQWKAHSDSITAFSSETEHFSSSSTLISCSMDCTCKFWTLPNGFLIRTVAFPCAIFGVAVDSSRDTKLFYAAGADGLIYKGTIAMNSSGLVSWSEKHNGLIVSLVLVNEGKNLVSAADDGSVWMWDVTKGEVIMVLGANNNNGIRRRTISDMIVAKGKIEHGVIRKGNVNNVVGDEDEVVGGLFSSSMLCDEEMVRSLMQITEVGDVLDLVIHDRKKAIDMLESSIAMYVRLLKLILEEGMRAMRVCNDEEKAEEDKEKDHGEEEKEK